MIYLRDQPLETSDVTRNKVVALLINVLALQVQLEPSNVIHGAEKIAVLCRALLSSNLSEPVLSDAFASFAAAVQYCLIDAWNQPSQAVVNFLREAHLRLPDLHVISYVLFRYFVLRYITTKSNDDYENAMAFLDKILVPNSSTDGPNPFSGPALGIAAEIARSRFSFYGNPEYLEEAIFRFRNFLGSESLDDAEHSADVQTLELLERTRFNELGVTTGLLEANPSESGAVDLPPFSHLIASRVESNAVGGPSRTAQDCMWHLSVVQSMDRIADKADIEEAVKYCRLLLMWLQQSHDDVMIMTHLTLIATGKFLYHAFELTNDAEYLNEAIGVYQDILKMPNAQWIHFEVIRRLVLYSFLRRYGLSYDKRDVDEIFRLYPIAATNPYAKVPNRFEISCHWAYAARYFGHPSTSDAYKSAISLLQDSLAFAPTLETQHFRLVSMRDNIEKLPLDCASYQVRTGRLRDAIETLEQGRGLLWSEMRGLRTSIDHLRTVDSCLAEKFAAVNRDLEALTMSSSLMISSNGGNIDDDEVMDPIGRVVVKQRKLWDERTIIITQIRSLPGFETFLMSLSFDTLRSAAAHGPVVIINHSKWRSDIIILLYDSPPSYISTPDTFYDRARGLKEELLAARTMGLDSPEYEDALTSVLSTLYDLVGRPVIQRLKKLNVPEQSRIWWCPTSAFCSLPLHAMGPVRSEGALKLYFSDLYIPSYTPTLSALIESRKPGPHSFETIATSCGTTG